MVRAAFDWHAMRLFARMAPSTLVRSACMKAVALFAGSLLSALVVCASARAADGLPVLRGEPTQPATSGENPLPAAAAAHRPAAQAPAATRSAPPAAPSAARAAGSGAGVAGVVRLPDANSRAPAQPLRARPVLSWQSLLPGSIQ
jgi:hypothetical protein